MEKKTGNWYVDGETDLSGLPEDAARAIALVLDCCGRKVYSGYKE